MGGKLSVEYFYIMYFIVLTIHKADLSEIQQKIVIKIQIPK